MLAIVVIFVVIGIGSHSKRRMDELIRRARAFGINPDKSRMVHCLIYTIFGELHRTWWELGGVGSCKLGVGRYHKLGPVAVPLA